MLLETTPTSGNGSANPPRAYAFHRLTLDEAGVANAQAVVNDFDERYYGPLGSEPNTRPAGGARVQGDLYFSTADNQMKVWNNAASQWDDVASSASSNIVTLTPAFNGSETEFTCSTVPVDAQSLLLSINGVIQKPNSGTSAPSEGFVKLANGKIKLGSAPLSGATYFAVSLGNTVSVGTPSPNTVGATELKTGEIANTHISSSAAIAKSKLASLDIVNADVNASAAIAKSKLASLDIVNADVNSSAAIAGSKINPVGLANVGIATTSPTNNLHIGASGADQKRSIKIDGTNGSSELQGVILESDGENGKFHIKTALGGGTPTEKLTILGSNGNLGINTTSPTAELEIFHATDPEIHLNINTHGDVGTILGDADGLTLSGNGSSNQIRFKTAGNHVMRIDSSGRVMIGQTSSVVPFMVTAGASGFGGENTIAVFADSTYPATGVGGGVTFAGRYNSGASQVGYAAIRGRKANATDGNYDGVLTFAVRPNGSNMTERVRIGSDGRVLMGTTSFSNISSNAVLTLSQGSSSATRLNLTNTGSSAMESTQIFSQNNELAFTAGSSGTEKLRIHDDGDVEINDGDLKIGTAGHGIDFSATANASQGSASNHNELLDDYEEGTWSPGIDKNASSMSVSYNASTTSGTYTKIGRMVTVWFDINVTSGGTSGSGSPYITELPFAVHFGQATQGGYGAPQFRDMTLTHGNMRIYGNSSYLANSQIYLQQFNSSGNTESSSLNGSGRLTGQATYFTI